jgi:hypothetical protein
MVFINGLRVRVGNEFVNGIQLPPPPPAANTVRVRTNDGNVPIKGSSTSYETATLVDGTTDVYDVYKSGNNFTNLLHSSTNVVEVLDANTTDVIYMYSMFWRCSSLSSVSLFDTSNVLDMAYMFCNCNSLTYIPLFNTERVTQTWEMFAGCENVQGGALALYKQMSSQANPPTSHGQTFWFCGSNTETGAAELAQIPDDWK